MRADMVVYGKTVAGGMPIGVVCGTKALMRRFDPERPMRIAYVVGTFSGASGRDGRDERVPPLGGRAGRPRAAYDGDERALRATGCARPTERLADAALPLRVVHLGTIWTVLFTEPGRYNWLLQYYLRAEGVTLSWVGTGRCLSQHGLHRRRTTRRCSTSSSAAAHAMKADGWWLTRRRAPGKGQDACEARLVREMLGSLVRVPAPAADASTPRSCGARRTTTTPRTATRQPDLPHRQLERVPRLLRARLLGPHHGDVGRAGRPVPAPDRPRGPGAALPRQGGDCCSGSTPATRRSSWAPTSPSPSSTSLLAPAWTGAALGRSWRRSRSSGSSGP